MCDGTTDASITEQEVVYVFFVDPDTMEPTLTFFECLGLEDSQYGNNIFEAIKKAFEKCDLLALLDKLIFLSSGGVSVNNSKKSGLILFFREGREWVTFIWCFSHCLELALKDALKDSISSVDESLMHLYYFYKKSSKKHIELKSSEKKNQQEFHGDGVRPVRATGT